MRPTESGLRQRTEANETESASPERADEGNLTNVVLERAALNLPGARRAAFLARPPELDDSIPTVGAPSASDLRREASAIGRVWLAQDSCEDDGPGRYAFPVFALGRLIGFWDVDFDRLPGAEHEAQFAAFELLILRAAARREAARLRGLVESERECLGHHVRSFQELQGQLDITEQIALTGSFRWTPQDGRQIWTLMNYHLHGYALSDGPPSYQMWMARMHPDDAESFQTAIDVGVAAGEPINVEYRLVMPDGYVRYVLARARPHISGDWIGTVVDVTELRTSEDVLRSTQSALAKVQRVTTLGELAAAIAHEVNQPLTSIVANAGAANRWLQREPPNLERAAASLTSIGQDGRRAGDVIQGLNALMFGRGSKFAPVSMDAVVRESIHMARPDLDKQGVQLVTRLSTEHHQVLGDVGQLQEVLFNLLSNAADAVADNQGQQMLIEISTQVGNDNTIVLEVADTGSGIDAEAAEHIFEAFYSTKATGIGMGLSICRSIVERHRGVLSFRPGVSRGSVFQISLPLI
jgi:signal transduction histidine kinase